MNKNEQIGEDKKYKTLPQNLRYISNISNRPETGEESMDSLELEASLWGGQSKLERIRWKKSKPRIDQETPTRNRLGKS